MPVVEGLPGGGATHLASLLESRASADQDRGMAFWSRYMGEKARHRDNAYNALGAIKQKREADEAAKAAEEGTPWGAIGGAALGALLAIPTFGLSLATIPAALASAPTLLGAAGLGSSIGGAVFDKNPARGAAISDATNRFGSLLDEQYVPNPGSKVPSPLKRAAEGGDVTDLPGRQGEWASRGGGVEKNTPAQKKKGKKDGQSTAKGVALLSPENLKVEFERRGIVENPWA